MESRWILFNEIPVAIQLMPTCGGRLYLVSPAESEAVHNSLDEGALAAKGRPVHPAFQGYQ